MKRDPVPITDEFGPLTPDQISFNAAVDHVHEMCVNRAGRFSRRWRKVKQLASVSGSEAPGVPK